MISDTQDVTISFEDTYCIRFVDANGESDNDTNHTYLLRHNLPQRITKHIQFNKSGVFSLPYITIKANGYCFTKVISILK